MVESNSYINTDKFSAHLRNKGIDLDSKKILITNFSNSDQSKDLTLPPNCNGFGRIHHFKRSIDKVFPSNPLPIDPALKFFNLEDRNEIQVQVFQNAFCSWRCWYCFVDYELLSANPKFSEFKTVDELLDLYLQENDSPPIIDLSGGQPDLVPEWSLWMADALYARGLDKKIYLWSDDNLSNDYLWRYLNKSQVKRLASYKNYGRVGCFKGFDRNSFSFNTKAEPQLFDQQFRLMNRIVNSGFDVYGYVTLTSNDDSNIYSKIKDFVDRLQTEVHPLFPLRTIPLKIIEFTPTKHRMSEEHYKSLSIQIDSVIAWNEELTRRFSVSELQSKIYEHRIN